MKKEVPELLKLINRRKCWEGPPRRGKPTVKKEDVIYASALMRRIDDSDPWAGPRAALYIRQGISLASDVIKEASNAIVRRTNASRNEDKSGHALTGLLKRMETDRKAKDVERAWAKHKRRKVA